MKNGSISKIHGCVHSILPKCELDSTRLPELPEIFEPGQFLSQLPSSVSVIVPPADSSYGNCDITADMAIHKNSSGWGPVARRAPLGKVIRQAAKGPESAEHVVLHSGDSTLLPLFSLSHAKLLSFFFPPTFFSPHFSHP